MHSHKGHSARIPLRENAHLTGRHGPLNQRRLKAGTSQIEQQGSGEARHGLRL